MTPEAPRLWHSATRHEAHFAGSDVRQTGTTFASRERVHDMTCFEVLPEALRQQHPPAVVMGDLTLVRSLGMAKIPSVVITHDPDDITLRSRHAAGHAVVSGFEAAAQARTAAQLVALGRRMKPYYCEKLPLFYGTDSQLAFLHAYREPLSEWFSFLLNDDALGRALWDKQPFYELAERAGIPVPQTARADDAAAVAALRSPLVIKPRAKVDWRELQRTLFDGNGKARELASSEELFADPVVQARRADLLVQECIPGTTLDLPSFHGFVDADGVLLAHYCGSKIRTYPATFGESSFIELKPDDRVEELGRRVIEKLGVRGVFKIDFIRDQRDDRLYVLELNARFTLWNYLGAVHGVNLPKIAYDYLVMGRNVPRAGSYHPRHRWLNFYRDLQAYRASRDGSLPFARWATSLVMSRNVYEAFAWSDPEPFAWWLAGHLRKKFV